MLHGVPTRCLPLLSSNPLTARYTRLWCLCSFAPAEWRGLPCASSFAVESGIPEDLPCGRFLLVILLRYPRAQLPSHICEGPLGCFAFRDAPLVSSLTVSLYVCVPLQLVEHPGNTSVLSWQRERCNQSPS